MTKATTLFGCLAIVFSFNSFSNDKLNLPAPISSNEQPSLMFTENKGQVIDQFNNVRPDVLFSGKVNGMVYHLRNNGVSYQLSRIDSWKTVEELTGIKNLKFGNHSKVPDQTTIYRVDLNWKNVNSDFTIDTENPTGGINNYYSGNTTDVANVNSYEGVVYHGIYKNINLHYYEKNNQLKYDYIVKPGADYKQIVLEIGGAKNINIQEDGSLMIETPLGNIQEGTPVVFQNGKELPSKWIVNGNELSFEVDNYNPSLEMVIDPCTRVWGTYYGGTGIDYGQSTTLDVSGNVYLAGYTNTGAGTTIATVGSNQATIGGGIDAFLVKFNSAGVRQWGTYYGGSGNDYGYSCKTDAAGNVFMTGYTGTATSALIASAGSHQAAYGGANDAFLVKFNSAGVRQWGTYYGGTGGDIAYACAVDAGGNVYISGYSSSTNANVISTVGSHQAVMGGTFDAFLAKFNSAGVRQWGTYYGGTGGEYSYGCAVDAGGNVFITGFTNSGVGTAIATVGSHQATFGGGDDAFLVKFNSAGVRQWGTYYGSATGNDYSYSCAADPSGNIYIAGLTDSGTGTVIATSGANQSVYGGSYDGFLVKFNTSGVRQWGTYYGDGSYDEAQSCATDGSGNVYLTGYTSSFSGTNIATFDAYQISYAGSNDVFLALFNTSGVRQWGTYYGGVGGDVGLSCVAEPTNYVYISGRSNTTTGGVIASAGSHQAAIGGNDDAFLVKFCNQPNQPTNLTPASNQTLCAGGATTLSVTGAGSIAWFNAPTGGAPITTGTVYVTPTLTAGTYTYYVEASTCTVSATRLPITVTVSAYPTITVNSGSICAGGSFTMTPSGAASYTFQGGSAVVSPTTNTSYTVTGSSSIGCLAVNVATANVTVISNPTISVNSGSMCIGSTFTMNPTGASTYTFQSGSAVVSPTANSTYTVIGSSGVGCISNVVTSSVTVNPVPVVTANNGTVCAGSSFTIVPSGASSYTYQGGSAVVNPTVSTSYTVVGSNAFGCVSNPASSFVFVNALPVVTAITSLTTICQGQTSNITAGGAITYTWNTGSNNVVIAVSPTVNSSYTVTGSDANGCTKSAVASITVNPLPTINIVSSPTAICVGQTGTLTANGASTYSWNTGSTSAAIAVSPTISTAYTVVGTSSLSCSRTVTASLTVNNLPVVSITPAFTIICTGQTSILNASGAATYSWNTGATSSGINASPLTNSAYTVTGTNSNGCTNTAVANVSVNISPTVSATPSSSLICAGKTITITALGATTYSWNTGSTAAFINATPTISTTYSVTGSYSNGCNHTVAVPITVNALPPINGTPSSTSICIGQTATITANGANTYTWNTSSNSVSITTSPTVSTNYTVSGTDANGCVNSASVGITVNSLPLISVASSNSLICSGQTATLTAGGATTYSWSTGATTPSISVSPTVSTTYTIDVVDGNGCANSDTITQYVSPCLGISSLQQNEFFISVYPNPGTGIYSVELYDETVVTIVDITGKQLFKEQLEAGKHTINLSEYAKGMYLLNAESHLVRKSIKLIKE